MDKKRQHAGEVAATGIMKDADVIIIGAGPAGMSAATELAGAGQNVIILDLQPTPGGQVYRNLEANLADRAECERLLEALGSGYMAGAKLIEHFRQTPGIDFRPETTVWEVRADGTVGWLSGGKAGYLRATDVIIATGAMERPAPFPGWTLPGVMTAGAVQTLLKAGRMMPEGRIVLAGTGPLIFLLADQLRRLGLKPAVFARTDRLMDKLQSIPKLRPAAVPALVKGLAWLTALRLTGVKTVAGIQNLRANGNMHIESVSFSTGGKIHEVDCDLLVVHDGVVPSTDLSHGAGIELLWQADQSWAPAAARDGKTAISENSALIAGSGNVWISGDARLIGGAEAAAAHGRIVACAILSRKNSNPTDLSCKAAKSRLRAYASAMAYRPFIDCAFPPGISASMPVDETLVCRCEEITAGTLRQAIRTGAKDINLIRGTLRCGMGPCQGRSCETTIASMLCQEGNDEARKPIKFRARPPARPLPLGALANLSGLDSSLSEIISLDDKPDAARHGGTNA